MPFSSKPVTHREWTWSLIIIMIVSFSLAGIGIAMSNARLKDSEAQFCEVMELSANSAKRRVEAYRSEPPTTEAGRVQAQETVIGLSAVENLMRKLGCSQKQERINP